MPFSFETFIVLLILLALCAVSLVKFHASWQPFFESVHTLFVDLVRDFRNIDWEAEAAKEAAEKAAPKQKEPLTWNRFKYRFTIPLTLTISFLLFFLLMKQLGAIIMEDKAQGGSLAPMLICAFVIAALVLLVIGVYGHYEKNPRRKFWLGLIITLAMELGVVFDLLLLLSGYFFRGARQGKSLVYSLLFLPVFVQFCVKTQHNWQAWQREKHPDVFPTPKQEQPEE